ncbi:MAG: class I SAM-dependent methyltransferase, partial [Elusimicrobiota bacterium]
MENGDKAPAARGVPPAAHTGAIPWVRLRSAASGPQLYKRMIAEADPKAKAGDIVAVYDKTGAPYGAALYNPKSLIGLRLLQRGLEGFDAEAFFTEKLARAVELRRGLLRLDDTTQAYRLVHDNGDGLPGLVVDRYADRIVLEFYSLGMFHQAARIERGFKAHFPEAKFVHRASQHAQTMEGFRLKPAAPSRVRVRENGVLFEIELSAGRKTGFFCDQRENRLAFASFAAGRKTVDVCAYIGGFGLYAAKAGASEVACVELDPEACEAVRRNSNINQAR